jgi:hypothetical protein
MACSGANFTFTSTFIFTLEGTYMNTVTVKRKDIFILFWKYIDVQNQWWVVNFILLKSSPLSTAAFDNVWSCTFISLISSWCVALLSTWRTLSLLYTESAVHFLLGGKYLCKTETCLKRNMLGCLGVNFRNGLYTTELLCPRAQWIRLEGWTKLTICSLCCHEYLWHPRALPPRFYNPSFKPGF